MKTLDGLRKGKAIDTEDRHHHRVNLPCIMPIIAIMFVYKKVTISRERRPARIALKLIFIRKIAHQHGEISAKMHIGDVCRRLAPMPAEVKSWPQQKNWLS